MEVMEALKGRQSIKSYLSTPVEKEKLIKVLEAGRLAPSAYNDQNRHFVVITDAAIKAAIREKAGAQPMIVKAPVVIAVCASADMNDIMPNGEKSYPINMALCGAYMMLEAYAQGLGTCWLGAYNSEAVGQILGLPKMAKVVTLIPLGYHDGSQERKPRKPLDEIVTYNKY